MARSIIRTDRFIAGLGVLVLLLGGVSLWVAFGHDSRRAEPSESQRALSQLREQIGAGAELRHVENGEGRIVCGYGGIRGEAQAVAFISRPRRILTSNDPLSAEFNALIREACPAFAETLAKGNATSGGGSAAASTVSLAPAETGGN